MPKYKKVQFIAYGSVTSEPTQVLKDDELDQFQHDAEIRVKTLADVAKWAQEKFRSTLGGDDTLKVFVAPEFYLRYGGPNRNPAKLLDSYPNAESTLPNVIEGTLRPLIEGKAYKDWLFVPGSMFWHKPAEQTGVGHDTYFNTVVVARGGPRVDPSPSAAADNRESGEVPTMGTVSTNQKQLMSTIDYSLDEELGRRRAAWDASLNPMFEVILGDWEWWRWHVFKVQDVDGPNGRPLVFGLEVCLEHVDTIANPSTGLGVLRTLTEPGQGKWASPPEIDVHLLTACGMPLSAQKGIAARVNGLVARCDGIQPYVEDDDAAPDWPAANFERVTNIDHRRRRVTAPVVPGPVTAVVPAQLQVGYRNGDVPHDPPDSVSVWPAQAI